MDTEAADKKCSLSELIRQKIIFVYEHLFVDKVPANFIFTYLALSIEKARADV